MVTNLIRVNENKATRRVFKLPIAAHLFTTFLGHVGTRRAYVISARQNTESAVCRFCHPGHGYSGIALEGNDKNIKVYWFFFSGNVF